MKQSFNKILAILMAFVVLFSTMSFTISEHFCGDHLVDSALFSKAESCGMEMQNPSPTKDCSINKDNCCSDVLKQFEGQTNLKTDLSNLTFEQQVFVTSFIYSYVNLFEGLDQNIIPFKNYSPPFIVRDIQTLDEVFLI
jgi:hypothetical protein